MEKYDYIQLYKIYDKPLPRFSSFLVYPPVHHHLTFDLFSQWAPFLTDSAAVRMTKGEGAGRESETTMGKLLDWRLRAFSLKTIIEQVPCLSLMQTNKTLGQCLVIVCWKTHCARCGSSRRNNNALNLWPLFAYAAYNLMWVSFIPLF